MVLNVLLIPDRQKSVEAFDTCTSAEEPEIFTGHSRNLRVDFESRGNSSGRGFQISILSIEGANAFLWAKM